MKKSLLIVAIFALMFAPLAMAKQAESLHHFSTYRPHDHGYIDTDTWRDEYEPKFEAGIGVDLVVYQNADQGFIPDEVTVESKYDISNNNGSVYIVAKYNIWERFFSGE